MLLRQMEYLQAVIEKTEISIWQQNSVMSHSLPFPSRSKN